MNETPNLEKPEASQPPELTLADLGAIKNIIEVATQRGAFKAHEISSVGSIYDKLAIFLSNINKQAQKPNSDGEN